MNKKNLDDLSSIHPLSLHIKKIAKKNKNFTLKDLSKELGYADNYISNMCNKDSTILSNNLLHKISTTLNCTLIELNEDL